jgi:branched-subunit amino acid ABC-type transport system permease component
MIHQILQSAVNGVVLGAMIGLVALAFTLIWAIERFPNLAQGDMLTLGAYLAFDLNILNGLPVLLSGALAVVGMGFFVLLLYMLVFRPFAKAPMVTLLIVSLGLALALRGLIGLRWGTELQGYDLELTASLSILGLLINRIDLVILGTVVALLIMLYTLLYRTRIGTEMRAVSDVRDLARVSGINSRRVLNMTWITAGCVTAASGVLLAAKLNLTPLLGWKLLLPMFAAATLGGVGSLHGAIIGGLIIGIVTEVSTIWINPAYQVAISFVIIALILLFRPRGLFGST